ncbi:MAG: DUF11 domain-containing protein [Ruminococcus sp.]|nr:DUF11 domain-containing protein [Ruminococcus sp.]
MKNLKIFALMLVVMVGMLFLPMKVDAEAWYPNSITASQTTTDAEGRKTYTYNLVVNINGSTEINHLEGRLVLTNLEVEDFTASDQFDSVTFNNNTYNLTANRYFTARDSQLMFATVKVKQINKDQACAFNYEPTKTTKENVNEFTIDKKAYKDGKEVSEVKPGESFQYKITVTSNNNVLETDEVTVTDVVPNGIEVLSIEDGGTYGNIGSTVNWNLGSFKAGTSTKTLTLNVKAGEDLSGVYKNIATLKVGDKTKEAENTIRVSDSDISVTKKVSQATINAGTKFHYTIEVRNNGTSKSGNITVEDALDSNLTFLESSVNHQISGNTLTFDIGTLEAGSAKTILVFVQAKDPLNVTNISNTVKVTEEGKGTKEATVDVKVEEKIDDNISITKSASKDKIGKKEEFKYTITITNNKSTKLSNIEVKDVIDSNLAIVNISDNGSMGGNNTITWKFDLEGKATKELVVTVKPINNIKATTVKNGATLTYDGKTIDSNVVEVTISTSDAVLPDNPKDDPTLPSNPQTGTTISAIIIAVVGLVSAYIFKNVKHKNKIYRIK